MKKGDPKLQEANIIIIKKRKINRNEPVHDDDTLDTLVRINTLQRLFDFRLFLCNRKMEEKNGKMKCSVIYLKTNFRIEKKIRLYSMIKRNIF